MEKVVLFAVICCLLFGQTISLNAISTEDCIGSEKNFKYFSLSENDVTVELGKNIQLDVLGEYICVCRNSEWIGSKMHNSCYSEGNQADRNKIE